MKIQNQYQPDAVGLFRGLSSEFYHNPGLGLSCSMAKTIAYRSLEHCKYEMDNPPEPTNFMELGALAHLASLEPTKLKDSYHIRPMSYPGKDGMKPWHAGSTWCKDWLIAHQDLPCITIEDEATLWGITQKVRGHPLLQQMLNVGEAEVSCFAYLDGLKVRCRPDLIAEDAEGRIWIIDLKTCEDASPSGFSRTVRQRHYDFQEAFYRLVLEQLDVRPHCFLFAAVERDAPHGIALYQLNQAKVAETAEKCQWAIDLYRQAIETGVWAGYPKEIVTLEWI